MARSNIQEDRFYVVDKIFGVATKPKLQGSDEYLDLFTWDNPHANAYGMTEEEADRFISVHSKSKSLNLRKCKGSFIELFKFVPFREIVASLYAG